MFLPRTVFYLPQEERLLGIMMIAAILNQKRGLKPQYSAYQFCH
jgi:hypothetical protein